MGYIHIKLSNIEIPNSFRVLCKADGGSNSPYPISGATWTDYGQTYSGGTTEIMLSGNSGVYDFQYSTTYWVKLEEIDYPERYVIKNIRINGINAYPFASQPAPSISPTRSVTPTRPVASVSRTPSATASVTPSLSVTSTPGISVSPTPSRSIGSSVTPTATRTPSISQSLLGEIYFASISGNDAIMGVNNALGRTFSISLFYELTASVDNVWSMGGDPVQTTTYIYVSTNGGSSWTEIDSVTASIPGSGPPDEYDYQLKTGTTVISSITNVSQVRVRFGYQCASTQDYKDGSGYAQITSASVDSGSVVVICNNQYVAGCGYSPYLSCIGVTPSPTRTQPSPTPTPTPSPQVILIDLGNQAEDYAVVNNMRINGVYVTDITPAYPYYPGDSGTARSPIGSGVYSVDIEIFGSSPSARRIDLYDSSSTYHCVTVPAYTNGWFTFTNVHMTTTGMTIFVRPAGYGVCPSPSLSVSRTVTPTRTPTSSFGSTPTASVTRSLTPLPLSPTPTPSPTVFGYYVDISYCAFPTCQYNIGSAWVENSYYLQVGYYYIYDTNTIFYVTTASTPGGDVTNVSGPGYSTCDQACSNT